MLLTDPRPLSDEDLRRYTKQTAIRDASTASHLIPAAEHAARLASRRVLKHALSLPGRFIRYLATFVTIGADVADAFIIGAILTLPVVIPLIGPFKPPTLVVVAMCPAITGILTLGFYMILRTRSEERDTNRREFRRTRFRHFFRDRRLLVEQHQAAIKDLQYKHWLRTQLERAERKADEIAALLATDLRLMSGAGHQFEEFLEQVFLVLGYAEVHLTRCTGDQGIDLIAGDRRVRVGIQAKLYSETVGNKAVQEAVAGMAIYHCHRCAVITNADFTRSAVELAEANSCRLINGEGLRRVIEGREML